MTRLIPWIAIITLALVGLEHAARAGGFSGTFVGSDSNGQEVLEVTETNGQVTGVLSLAGTAMRFAGPNKAGKVAARAKLDGAPVSFDVVFRVEGDHLVGEITEMDDNGQPDPHTTERVVFSRKGGAATTAPAVTPAASKQQVGKAPVSTKDRSGLDTIAGRVKGGANRPGDVLAAGQPPLTRASLAAFAEVLRITFGVELSEAEYDESVRAFVAYYQAGDAATRTMLATGWQSIVTELGKSKGAAHTKAVAEVHDVLAQRFAAGAQANIAWAVTMNATLQRRTSTVATMSKPVSAAGKKAEFDTQMSEADLNAAMEMLYFMWVASGRDPALVTPDAVTLVRSRIVQGFATFPPDVQLIFANAQKVYSAMRGQWAQASAAQRAQLAQQYATSLDTLGLTVPGTNNGGNTNAWSDVSGKSHGEWAGEMVQGLAGSSYHSSW